MSDPDSLQRLAAIHDALHLQLERAEARVPPIQDLILRLVLLDLLPETILLGPVLYERPYDVSTDRGDSYEVLVAALVIPGGLGVVCWDRDAHSAHVRGPSNNPANVFHGFVPFERCSAGVKALLQPHVVELLDRLADAVLPRTEGPSRDASP